eukprot:TRINITY_DN13567_c0_g1_i1.p1 TRINITY_DN13567_c0_g1~~TRINITY_DN13567_c0_g1_i1.p1  ORF type:complete len:435 (-),score=77.58 TRINITY_DN13567_c0_g1_i1:3-1199(-)
MFKLILLLFSVFLRDVILIDPDTGLDMEQIAISKGYLSIEKHFVTTEDGYILGVYRIPRGRNEPVDSTQPKKVVLLQHGLLDSSWTWVANFPTSSLGFILADNSYDVWFGNSRGNFYSLAHTTYPVDSDQFWDFTWDEMAEYDLPAVILYILKTTGQQKLSYVGHSQGTIQAFACFSENKTIASLVDRAILLAPVAYAHHSTGLMPLLADLDIDELFLLFGLREFLPDASLLQKLVPGICEWVEWGCEDILFLIVGGSNNLNQSRIEVYISETPAGTSVKNMVHWAQSTRSDVFQKYDYGSATLNILHYGQPTPPAYNLSNYDVPSALYYGGNDILADPTDVAALLGDLPDNVVIQSLFQPGFAHLDYTWGFDDTAKAVYANVLKELNSVVILNNKWK